MIGCHFEHRMQRLEKTDFQSFIGIETTLIQAEIANLSFEGGAPLFISDLQFSPVEGRGHWIIAQNIDRRTLTVYINLNALGGSGTVIRDGDVTPAFELGSSQALHFETGFGTVVAQPYKDGAILFVAIIDGDLVTGTGFRRSRVFL